MNIERLAKKGAEKLAFVREQLGLDPLLVLHYLEREEKKPLESEYPMVNFDRAIVAMTTTRGSDKVREMRRFLQGFAELETGPGITKHVRLLFIEGKQSELESDFWVIFVHQVFEGQPSGRNISYLTDREVDEWEKATASHLRHFVGGVTVIRG